MRNKRIRAANNKGGRRGSSSTDFISEMSNDILLFIISFLPIKDAVMTSSLSKRWTTLWSNLLTLNFESTASLVNVAKNRKLLGPERIKFIHQVNCVLNSYSQPRVEDFRIRYDLDKRFKLNIDAWLLFALHMSVENLELDLADCCQKLRNTNECYDFSVDQLHRSNGHLHQWPTSSFRTIEFTSLRRLFFRSVNMRSTTLQRILATSRHLETLSLHGVGLLEYVNAGRQRLKLKHLEIVYCPEVDFIYLNDCNLVTLTYKGRPIELFPSNLPDLKVVDIDDGVLGGLENNVFRQISFCLSYLQILSLDIHRPKESLKLGSIPGLPMIKNLKLTIGAQRDDCLLKFTSIAQACPILEVLTIQLNWLSPIRRRRKVIRHVGDHSHKQLKQLKFVGYYGRVSDLELVIYVMENAAGLKKISIDPCGSTRRGTTTVVASMKAVEAARSIAMRQLEKLMPCSRGVEFDIL